MELKIIAYIRTDFPEKFGIPRQPGVVAELKGRIVFEPEFRNPDLLRGMEDFSHLWLLWQFSDNLNEAGEAKWSPTVRPPRLGGNKRLGVFATRSPFRPNPIGMSAVKIDEIRYGTPEGPVIYVSGADMLDRTPIYDIKPYIGYTDSIADTRGGFTDTTEYSTLQVGFSEKTVTWRQIYEGTTTGEKKEFISTLVKILENDPRPHYQKDPNRVYGMAYAGYEVKFSVEEGLLTILEIIKKAKQRNGQ